MKITSLQEKQFYQTFWNLFNTGDQGRDGGGNGIICSLYRSLWSMQRLQVLYQSKQRNLLENGQVQQCHQHTYCKLEPPPLVSSRFVYASLFIFRVGSLYFDLFPFVHNKKNHVNWSNSSMATFVKSQHTCISSSTSKMFSSCQMWHNLVPRQLWH